MLDYEMNKQMRTFSISPPIPLVEEGKWVLAVTSSGAIIFVFNIKKFIRIKELLEVREENDIELHAAEVRKRTNHIKVGDNE